MRSSGESVTQAILVMTIGPVIEQKAVDWHWIDYVLFHNILVIKLSLLDLVFYIKIE